MKQSTSSRRKGGEGGGVYCTVYLALEKRGRGGKKIMSEGYKKLSSIHIKSFPLSPFKSNSQCSLGHKLTTTKNDLKALYAWPLYGLHPRDRVGMLGHCFLPPYWMTSTQLRCRPWWRLLRQKIIPCLVPCLDFLVSPLPTPLFCSLHWNSSLWPGAEMNMNWCKLNRLGVSPNQLK